FISDKSALTVYTNQFFHNSEGITEAHVLNTSNNVFYNNFDNSKGDYRNQDYSLNFKQDFGKEDHYIVLDAIYSTSENDDTRNYINSFPQEVQFTELREGENSNARINLDY